MPIIVDKNHDFRDPLRLFRRTEAEKSKRETKRDTVPERQPDVPDKKVRGNPDAQGLARLVPAGEKQPASAKPGSLTFAHKGQDALTPEFTEILASTSSAIGRPLHIQSGYRPKTHKVERRKKSGGGEHTRGHAADISMAGMSNGERQRLISELRSRGAKRFITYSRSPDLLHVDMKDQRGDGSAWFMYDRTARKMKNAPEWYRQAAEDATGVKATTSSSPARVQKSATTVEPGFEGKDPMGLYRGQDNPITAAARLDLPDEGPMPDPRPRLRPLGPGEGVTNEDGTVSTERTVTIQDRNGKWLNVPTLWKDGDAIIDLAGDEGRLNNVVAEHESSGDPLQRFATVEEAEQAARSRSEMLGRQISAEQQHAELEADEPGRYKVMSPDEYSAWKQDFDEKHQSTGYLGDFKRSVISGMGSADEGAEWLLERIPWIGPIINDAIDGTHKLLSGKEYQQSRQEMMDRAWATMTPEQQEATLKEFVKEVPNPDGSISYRAGKAWSDPRSYMHLVGQSLPITVMSMAPGGILARGAYSRAIAQGLTKQVAANKAATTAMLAGGLTEGLFAGGETAIAIRREFEAMPDSVFETSDAARVLMEGGMSLQEAREKLSSDAETQGFLIAGFATSVFGGQGDRILTKIITARLDKNVVQRISSGAIKSAVAEGLIEEAPQSAAEQIATNIGVQSVDPSRRTMQGVPNAVAAGTVAGGITGGALGGTAGAISPGSEEQADTGAAAPPVPEAEQQTPQPAQGALGRARDHGAARETERAGTAATQLQQSELELSRQFPQNATVTIDPGDGVTEPFMATVQGYDGGEVLVLDSTTGEYLQIPPEALTVTAPPPTSGPVEPGTPAPPLPEPPIEVDAPPPVADPAEAEPAQDGDADAVTAPQPEQDGAVTATPDEQEPGPTDGLTRAVGDRTALFADPDHTALYDLGDKIQRGRINSGQSGSRLSRLLENERQNVAQRFGLPIESVDEIADDYRYRVQRDARTAKAAEYTAPLVNAKLIARRQVEKMEQAAAEIDAAAKDAATSPDNALPEPTQAQKEAGNYKMGHAQIGGLDISIENPAGSTRSGTGKDGNEWSVEMKSHYGYIKGTVGRDKDHIDVFMRPGLEALPDTAPVFVVDQVDDKGDFDEHKVMMGYADKAAARRAYLENYDDDWDGLGAITRVSHGDFKAWLASGNTKKPYGATSAPSKSVENRQNPAKSANTKPTSKPDEGEALTQDTVTKTVRSKQWKKVFGSTTNINADTKHYAHHESPVAYEQVQGWLDAKDGKDPAPLKDGNAGARVAYLEGYIGGRFGVAVEIRGKDAALTREAIISGDSRYDPENIKADEELRKQVDLDRVIPRPLEPETFKGDAYSDLGINNVVLQGDIGANARDVVLERGRADGMEHLIAVDEHGDVIANLRGTKSTTGMTKLLMSAFQDPDESVVVHHNHPRSTSLSHSDLIYTFLPGLHAVYAHGHDGVSYRATMTEDARRAVAAKLPINSSVENIHEVVVSTVPRLRDTPLDDMIRFNIADAEFIEKVALDFRHIANQALHDAGWIIYSTERAPSALLDDANMKAAYDATVEKYKQQLEESRAKSTAFRVGGRAITLRHKADLEDLHPGTGSPPAVGPAQTTAQTGSRRPAQRTSRSGPKEDGERQGKLTLEEDRPENLLRPVYYSALLRAVEGLTQPRAPADQWKAMIANRPGVKPEEIDWMGLNEWLDSHDGPITRDAIVDFIRANQLQIGEVLRGNGATAEVTMSDWYDDDPVEFIESRAEDEFITLATAKVAEEQDIDLDDVPYEKALERAIEMSREDYFSDPDRTRLRDVTVTIDDHDKETSMSLDFQLTMRGGYELEIWSSDIEDGSSLHDGRVMDDARIQNLVTEATAEFYNIDVDGLTGAQYGNWTIEGGDKYRELLLTLPPESQPRRPFSIRPPKDPNGLVSEQDWTIHDPDGVLIEKRGTEEAAKARAEQLADYNAKHAANYYSDHFNVPNIVAHVRLTDRADVDGKATLFVEEIQSDWHQEGRKKGYGTKTVYDRLDDAGFITGTHDSELAAETARDLSGTPDQRIVERTVKTGIPNAPFKKTWDELSFKRVLREAVEKGYDRIAWTTGTQQNERYDLSSFVREIRVKAVKEQSRGLELITTDGRYIILSVDNEGVLHKGRYGDEGLAGRSLDEAFGKDLAKKIMSATEDTVLAGNDLEIGGDGMRGFYDRKLPNIVNKLVKKWGARTGKTEITVGGHRETVHSVDVTEPMREAVLAGLPMFSAKGGFTVETDTPQGKALSEEDRAKILGIIQDVAGLDDVRFQDEITLPDGARGWGKNAPSTAAGVYDPVADAVTIALDSGTDRTAYHEAFHRLQRLFLTEDEKAVLRGDAPRLRRMVRNDEFRRSQVDGMSQTEIEAEAFALYATGAGRNRPQQALRAAWDRIRQALHRVVNYLAGKGFQTSESIFARALRGDIAARGAGISTRSGEVQAAAAPSGARKGGLPNTAKELTRWRNISPMKAHADYTDAKAGDPDAAMRLVLDSVGKDRLVQAKDTFGSDVIYVPVAALEASGANALPTAMALHYAKATGAAYTADIVQSNKAFHTGANAMERLISRARFDGPVQAGAKYVLVDDVTVMGSTLADLADHIISGGGEVAGVVTLVDASRPGSLVPKKQLLNQVKRRFGDEIGRIFEIEAEALTEPEARYVLNFRDVDALRARAAKAQDQRRLRLSGKEIRPEDPEGLDPQYSANPDPDEPIPTPVSENRVVETIAGALTDLKPHALATVPLNYFTDLARPNMVAVGQYLDVKRMMDAYRGRKHAQWDEIAQRWLKYVRLGFGRNGKAKAKVLADLMHDSTLAGVDPASIAKDMKASPKYADLRKRFTALPKAAQKVFIDVRNAYEAQAKEVDDILLQNVRKAYHIAEKRAEEAYNREMEKIAAADMSKRDRLQAEKQASDTFKAQRTRAGFSMKARLTRLRMAFESSRVPAPYFPLKRFGQYFVVVRGADGAVKSFSRRERAASRDRLARQMRKAYPDAKIEVGVLSDAESMRDMMDPTLVADIEEIIGKSSIDPDVVSGVLDQIWQRYLETMPDLSIRKRFIHRQGTPGYDEDALRGFSSHMFHAAHQMAKLKYGMELAELTNDIAKQGREADDSTRGVILANEMRKRHDWVMNPTGGQTAQIMTSAAFAYYLGLTPAAALVNMTQTPMLGIPILGARFGSVTRAAAAMLKASGDTIAGRGSLEKSNLTNDERDALARFYDSGLIDRTQSHDLAGVGDTGVEYRPLRAKVMEVISFMFHKAEVWNREVTSIAAYRLARKAGQTHLDAINTAHDLTWKTHFDYSNSSRPRMMQNDFAKVALVFRAHNINMLYRLFRDIHQSFKGESAQARKEARMQLAGIVGMMSLLAGTTGTIGFNLVMTLAGLVFGEDDDPIDFQERFKKDVIDALGPELGGVVLYGVPGHYTGVSLSNRIGMPDLWFRSPNRDLQGKDEWHFWLQQVAGASVSMIGQGFSGVSMIRDGNMRRGVETILPKWARDLLRAQRYAEEGVTDYRGNQIVPVEDLTALDIVTQAAGFTPAKVAETWERNSALKNAEARVMRKRSKLLAEYALAVKLGDEEAARNALKRIQAFNASPHHRGVAISPKTVRNSLRTRRRNEIRRKDGVLIQNEYLGHQLRQQVPDLIYR
ncbi:PLxRFG domain-containing protein [Hoeflea poritis]|uniref:PLxRFG domain-containing protein n=1 Tax=Hoeflea poritis TaxID=2993659 RepID=A0ABT4VMM0_9HYPH|nr:PLxRFG domain-containing protein [Hoeflea poritis]MDA4845960.1 PLxRFG domain-containing protein [Hoeflea poritis]